MASPLSSHCVPDTLLSDGHELHLLSLLGLSEVMTCLVGEQLRPESLRTDVRYQADNDRVETLINVCLTPQPELPNAPPELSGQNKFLNPITLNTWLEIENMNGFHRNLVKFWCKRAMKDN